MSLSALPLELKLKAIVELEAWDILHLEQSCKNMYELIEGSPDVWKSLLKRLCASEKWIWVSYDDLSTAFDFKSACVRSMRFIKLVCGEDSNNLTETLEIIRPFASTAVKPRSSSIDGPLSAFDSGTFKGEFASAAAVVYLVPGGRFLVTVHVPWLFLWDLRTSAFEGSTSGTPSILSRHRLSFQGRTMRAPSIVLAEVIEASTVRILLEEAEPEGVSTFKYSFELVEIEFTAGDKPFSRTLGQLRVLYPMDTYATPVATYHGHQVFIQWTYHILARPKKLLYVDVAGVHGLPFPNEGVYRAVPVGVVPLRQRSPPLEIPFTFSIPHPEDTACLPSPSTHVTILRNDPDSGPIICAVGEYNYLEPSLDPGFSSNIYHYSFTDPTDPSEGTIRLAERNVYPPSWELSKPSHDFPCGADSVGYLWSNMSGYGPNAIVDRRSTIHISVTRLPSLSSTAETRHPPIIRSSRKETIPWRQTPGVPRVYSLCAATGRLAVLWWLMDPERESDRLLEVYDFL
ncbi:hypothetical protein D9611_010637 [Ephemerocybe angulata]|uniref:F-box domain-containing protein n=1 Tax=Ephemerocybe angulata TaxID=980116 RepID=A0A8H5BXA2_9AGAR|nr:hypothetical protein D9611_010637 [Tulosesus angulatus]